MRTSDLAVKVADDDPALEARLAAPSGKIAAPAHIHAHGLWAANSLQQSDILANWLAALLASVGGVVRILIAE